MIIVYFKLENLTGLLALAYNPSTQEAKAGGQFEFHSEDSLCYIEDTDFKKKKGNNSRKIQTEKETYKI